MKKLILFVSFIFIKNFVYADEYYIKPTGQYEVGFQDFHWINGEMSSVGNYICPEDKQDPFYKLGESKNNFSTNNQTNFCREIMTRVYFPIIWNAGKQRAKISESLYLNYRAVIEQQKVPTITEKDFTQFSQINTYTYDFNDYDLKQDTLNILDKNSRGELLKYPVIFFSPGNGSVFQDYENIINELVSWGYVVVGINNTFVSNQVVFPSEKDSPKRVVARSQILNSPDHQDLVMTVPDNDALFAIKNSFRKENLENNFIFKLFDRNHVSFLGHSGGGNVAIYLANTFKNIEQDNNIKINAVGSLDSAGTGLFTSADLWDFVNKKRLPKQIINLPPQDYIGAPIPFMHFHTSINDYGAQIAALGTYVIESSILPDQLVLHYPNEYWVYLAPESTFRDIPEVEGLEPPFSNDIYYSAHDDFTTSATLKYFKLPLEIKFYNYFSIDKQQMGLMQLGLGFGPNDTDYIVRQLNNINSYLLAFFNQYMKGKQNQNLKNCINFSDETILKCSND